MLFVVMCVLIALRSQVALSPGIRELSPADVVRAEPTVQRPTPAARAHHWLVYDEQSKSVLLTGGSTPVGNGFTFYDDVWRFDGAAWVHVTDSGLRLSGARIVYHAARKTLVAFGGFAPGNRIIGQLREWNGSSWSIIDPAEDKSAAEPGVAYDSRRNRLVVFGGSNAPRSNLGITWEWDGNRWMKFDVPGPSPRQAHGMVYDARRGQVVLFGGAGSNGPLGDTWEWDGHAWTQVATDGPPARVAPGMVFDSKRGRTILFGGDGPQVRGDTWSWNGTRWEMLTASGPEKRESPGMAYDASRDRIIMFGGRKAWPDDLNDSWSFDGIRWTEVRPG